MSEKPSKICLTPPHLGAFIRDEILDELHLNVSEAAEALGVRRATHHADEKRPQGAVAQVDGEPAR